MIPESWQTLIRRIDERSLRERLLTFATLATLLFALTHLLAIRPLEAARKETEREIIATQDRIGTLQETLRQLNERARHDPDQAVRRQIEQLEARLRGSNRSLAEITRGMIHPAEMAAVIATILDRNRGLKVITVENLPAAPLTPHAETGPADAAHEAGGDPRAEAPIYKHGLVLKVSGRYGALVRFLRDLESQPWKLIWDEAELEVEKYPVSRLTLIVYTLSFEPGWLAV